MPFRASKGQAMLRVGSFQRMERSPAGIVEIGRFIEDLGRLGEDEEAVGEAFRDPEKLDIVGGRLGLEMKSCPFAKLWRIAAEIDGDVPDMAGKDSNQLSLRLAELVVQASENAFSRKGLVVLYELTGQTGGEKCRLVEYLGEPTATISEALGLNESNVT